MSEEEKRTEEKTTDEKVNEPDRVIGWSSAATVARRSVAYLRRQVEKGRLRSDKNAAGENVFARTELEELRPTEPPAPVPLPPLTASDAAVAAKADGTASSAASVAARPMSEGELQAAVFDDLGHGKRISQIVIDRRLPLEDVLRIFNDWKKACLVDLNAPSVPAEVELLKKRMDDLQAENGAMKTIIEKQEERLEKWRAYLSGVETRLARLPFFTPEGVVCHDCGKNTWLPRQVMCMSCGANHFLGASEPGPDGKRKVEPVRVLPSKD